MIRRLAFVIALAAAAAPVARTAHADDALDENDPDYQKARKLSTAGRKLFDLGKFQQALAKFEAAYEAKPIPGLLFNIGQCHRNLDAYDAAIFSFKKYLRLIPDAPNKAAVLEYIDELEHERDKRSSEDLGLIEPERDPDQPRVVDPGPRPGKPIYKKWWFWGGIAAVGAGVVGTAVILSSGGPPGTTLGNVDISQ